MSVCAIRGANPDGNCVSWDRASRRMISMTTVDGVEMATVQQESEFEAALRTAELLVPAEKQIVDSYRRLMHWKSLEGVSGNRWIALSEIAAFTDIAADEWQRALIALHHAPGVHLIPEENQKTLTDSDRASAVVIGEQAKHLIAIDDGPAVNSPS